jgi:hypothetical protein
MLPPRWQRMVDEWLMNSGTAKLFLVSSVLVLAWIIHQVSSQKRKDALKGMMNTGFPDPAFPFGASIA